MEKEEFMQETDGETSCPYIPESGTAKDKYLISPLDLPQNGNEQLEELNCPVKIEKEEFQQQTHKETSYPFIIEFCPVNGKCLISPLDSKEDTAQLEGLTNPVKIEKEEFIQEIYGETSCSYRPIPESSPAEEEYLIASLDLPKMGTTQLEDNHGIKYNLSSKSKNQKKISILTRKKKTNEIQTHKNKKRFGCDSCSSVFTLRGDLVNHIRTHTGEKPFGCDSCSARFAQRSALTRHTRTHTGEKQFECDSCSAQFAWREALVRHIQSHSGEKPYGCNFCPTRFARRETLVRHIRTHSGEKPFQCKSCSVRFSEKSTLVNHIRTHTGEKPFVCDSCHAQFARRGALVRHIRTHAD